jgi:hypothetical protein
MSQNTVDLNGWDIATAISYDDVNLAIAKGNSSPKTFSANASDGSCSIIGTFGTWSLTRGSPLDQGTAGDDITMQIPITSGNVISGGVTTPITPCTAIATIKAIFIPQPDSPNQRALVPSQSTNDPATVDSCVPAQGKFINQSILVQLLQQWLQANLGVFNQVFAVVDLEADFSKQPGLGWMKPTHLGYATAEPRQVSGAPVPKNVFAVLALVDDNAPTAKTENTVSPFVIPDGADAGMVISPQMFLKHFMLPGAPYMFKDNPPASSFIIDNDELQITNSVDLIMGPFELDDGKEVTPSVPTGAFSLELVGTEFKINVDAGNYSPRFGFDATLWYKGVYTMSLDTVNRILDLNDVSHQSGGSCKAERGYVIAEIVMGVVSAAIGIVAGVAGFVAKSATSAINAAGDAAEISAATSTAAEGTAESAEEADQAVAQSCEWLGGTRSVQKLSSLAANLKAVAKLAGIAASIVGLPASLMGIAQAVIENDYSSSPKLDTLANKAVGEVVQWPTVIGQLELTSAQLNNCLQLGFNKRVN